MTQAILDEFCDVPFPSFSVSQLVQAGLHHFESPSQDLNLWHNTDMNNNNGRIIDCEGLFTYKEMMWFTWAWKFEIRMIFRILFTTVETCTRNTCTVRHYVVRSSHSSVLVATRLVLSSWLLPAACKGASPNMKKNPTLPVVPWRKNFDNLFNTY